MQVGPEMFFEFINMTPCPSPAIFTFENKMTFDGVCWLALFPHIITITPSSIHWLQSTFKNVLDEMNSDAIEYLPMALMQVFVGELTNNLLIVVT